MKLVQHAMVGVFFCSSVGLLGCSSMPTSGPSAKNIQQLDVTIDDSNDVSAKAIILDVNAQVIESLSERNTRELFSELSSYRVSGDIIGKGDVLDITIWEAPPAVLFGGALSNTGMAQGKSVELPAQMVDDNGVISIPFVGQIKVSGSSLRQVENKIVAGLLEKANQPQVVVRQSRNQASNVTVIREGNSVRMPLTSKGERVLDAVAAIDGVKFANKASIQLTRGAQVRTLPLMEITRNPKQNILLQSGDVITALEQPMSFIALGATGRNQEINFEQGLTLMQALGRLGGLNDNRADAQGVFVFRYEDEENVVNSSVAGGVAQVNHRLPVVYRVNMRDPNTFFFAQNFPMKDKDVIYIANAPASELQKFLRIVFSITSPITGTVNSIENISN